MRKLTLLASAMTLLALAVFSQAQRTPTSDERARELAIKLFASLSEEQKKLALKDFADKERLVEDFPAGNRPGLPMAQLTDPQKALVSDIVKALTSEYGAERCLVVAKQSGEAKRFINFFGAPAAGKTFGWRLVQHHLTLAYAEFGPEPAKEFGPVLLGGNPVKELWDEEEKIALEFYAALSAEEQQKIQAGKEAKQGSGGPIGKAGLRFADLNPKAKDLAKKLLAKRFDVFSAERQQVLMKIVQDTGGIDGLRIAVWGQITKGHLQGGTYHWRIGNDALVCDWQTAGAQHLHMTVRGRIKG